MSIFEQIQGENSRFRQKMLVMYFLSLVQDALSDEADSGMLPPCVTEALTYISVHYADRIIAEELAQMLGVSRTTLMTAFKKYVGITVNDYLIRCRIKNALTLLRQGKTEQQTAEECGFTNVYYFSRVFKQISGITPKKY